MRFKRVASAAAASAAIMIGALSGTVFATATLSTSVASGDVTVTAITVSATNLNATRVGTTMNLQQCIKDGNLDPTFNPVFDCTGVNATSKPIVTSGTGTSSKAINFINGQPTNSVSGIPDVAWGCGPLTPVGVTKFDTCYIRMTPAATGNLAVDEFYPVTYSAPTPTTTTEAPTTTTAGETTTTNAPGTEVPEVPMNILLPLSAAALIGGSVIVARRRGSNV